MGNLNDPSENCPCENVQRTGVEGKKDERGREEKGSGGGWGGPVE